MSDERFRVVFAEDNYLVREGIAALLREIDEVELLDVVEDVDMLLEVVERKRPDIVLTDIRMPPSQTNEGIEAAKQIRSKYPGTAVILLSQYVEKSYVHDLLEGGAEGVAYLLKERVRDVEELLAAMRTVRKKGLVLDPKIVEEFLNRGAPGSDSPIEQLTEREREVLEQMAHSKTNSAIAKALFVSERSVERHINSIFSKLGLSEETDIHRRVRAVLTFLEAKT